MTCGTDGVPVGRGIWDWDARRTVHRPSRRRPGEGAPARRSGPGGGRPRPLRQAAAVVEARRHDAVDVLLLRRVAARHQIGGLVAVHHAALGGAAPAGGRQGGSGAAVSAVAGSRGVGRAFETAGPFGRESLRFRRAEERRAPRRGLCLAAAHGPGGGGVWREPSGASAAAVCRSDADETHPPPHESSSSGSSSEVSSLSSGGNMNPVSLAEGKSDAAATAGRVSLCLLLLR